ATDQRSFWCFEPESRIHGRQIRMRISSSKRHQDHKVAGVLRFRSSYQRVPQGWTNFGIGTIAGGCSMFISPAFAQGSGAGGYAELLGSPIFMMIGIFVIMYLLILRPQQRRQKQHQELLKNIRRGDTIVTSGGLVGKVTKRVEDDQTELEIEIAEGV